MKLHSLPSVSLAESSWTLAIQDDFRVENAVYLSSMNLIVIESIELEFGCSLPKLEEIHRRHLFTIPNRIVLPELKIELKPLIITFMK